MKEEINITFEKILKAYLETNTPYVFLIGNNEERKSEIFVQEDLEDYIIQNIRNKTK